jgi:nitrate reductase NapE component
VREKEKKNREEKNRGWREGEVVCFVLILICIFFEVSTCCEWRAENPSFLHQPYSSCTHMEKGAIPLRTTQGDNCEGSSKRVFILFLFFYVYILPQSNLILHFILSK